MDLMEVGCDAGDWIDLAQDRVQWRVYTRTAITSGFIKSQVVSYTIIYPAKE